MVESMLAMSNASETTAKIAIERGLTDCDAAASLIGTACPLRVCVDVRAIQSHSLPTGPAKEPEKCAPQ